MQRHTMFYQCFVVSPLLSKSNLPTIDKNNPKVRQLLPSCFYCFLSRLKEADFIMLVHKRWSARKYVFATFVIDLCKEAKQNKKTPILAVFKLFMATPPQLLAAAANSHSDVKYK